LGMEKIGGRARGYKEKLKKPAIAKTSGVARRETKRI